jgi:glycosyltransferase involved in cell wall biosynthesis
VRVAIVNEVYAPDVDSPDALLDRFPALTGWAGAVAAAGATVAVFQRFAAGATRRRGSVDYVFAADAHPPRPPATFAAARAFHRAVADWAPDVVHVNGLDHPRSLRRLRRVLDGTGRRTAIAVQDHGGFDPRGVRTWRRAWMRHGLRSADALLVAAPPQIGCFRSSGLVPRRLRAYDVMEGSTDLRVTAPHHSHGQPALLWVGRLVDIKDPLTVLAGFAKYARAHAEATLTFVYQDSTLEPAVRAAVDRDERLRRAVALRGRVAHASLADEYAGADFFVLGSRREGSGFAALEALACGVPPLLTDIPTFRWLTDGGTVGRLWKPGDPDSLCAALDDAAAAPLAAQRDACRRRFEEHFSWPAIGRRATAIYEELSRS